MWFYMMPQSPKPAIHEVATKLYEPNEYDINRGLGSAFGATTMIINGGYECNTSSGQEDSRSRKRMSYY